MILSELQMLYVERVVWRNVKYQETFEEVYDHVITALQESPKAEMDFELEVFRVINESFGSFKLLKDKEKERVNIIDDQIERKYLDYIRAQFNSWLILFTLLSFAIIVYVVEGCSIYIVDVTTYLIGLIPIVIIAIRHFNNLINKRKKSVKSNAINRKAVILIPLIIYKLLGFVIAAPNTKLLPLTGAFLGASVIMIFLVCTLGFVRLYHEEVKMQLAL
jgi:hypothetical protein